MNRSIHGALTLAFLGSVALWVSCGGEPSSHSEIDGLAEPAPIAELDLSDMEPRVAARLRQTRRRLRTEPESADAWGTFGRVAHAHELWEPAAAAYRRAESLDAKDVRWPYFLGDVLSVVGTNLDLAIDAFRRSLALREDYAPAHLRLANVLVAADRPAEAHLAFERALELAPDLQPAQVGWAQLLLAEGELQRAVDLLEDVLESAPRHGQAIAALGQAYMRLGRSEEARTVAARAADAAAFNLFEDPLMSEVVAEGLSAVLIWDRAKAFLDNGNDEQAVLGLQQVVELLPENPEAHQQLAVAYGNLGRLEPARRHLERTLELVPDQPPARMQLATVLLSLQQPRAAIPHLQLILRDSPDDPDAPWMLGRAEILSGRLAEGLTRFDALTKAGRSVPLWVRNDWGNALAQRGEIEAALDQFETVLAENPEEPQALFFSGLLHEGQGELQRALDLYCRSMQSEPSPPAASRLEAHRHRCP